MRNFIIFFDEKEGSSAIIDYLNKFENIDIIGFEPFDKWVFIKSGKGEDMPINKINKCLHTIYQRKDNPGSAFLKEEYSKFNDNPKFLNKLNFDIKNVKGLKMRLKSNRWDNRQQIFKQLEKDGVTALVLVRSNIMNWALSKYKKGHLQFKLATGEIKKSEIEKIDFDLPKLKEIVRTCEKLHFRKFKILSELQNQKVRAVPIYYEHFLNNKYLFFRNLHHILNIPINDEEILRISNHNSYYKKVHGNSISDIALNADEILNSFPHLSFQM